MTDTHNTTPLLHVNDLRVFHHDGTQALDGVSFALAAGERVGVIGPNGAGKSSLLLTIMNGLHFHGNITIDGMELSRKTVDDARSRCGLVFQDADDQLFMPTLLEDVAFGPLNQRMDASAADEHARAAIAAVGLAGLEGKSAHHLSGGQKRVAAIATVLAMRVKLLLLDEPAANLDVRSRRRLIDLLAARDEAMLLASHDLDIIRRLCTRTIVLDAGKLIADGPTDAVLGDVKLLQRHGLMEAL